MDQLLQNKIEQFISARLTRRRFLGAAAGASVLTLLPFSGCSTDSSSKRNFLFSKEQKRTLTAVQEHLLPHEENSPGAKDINAANYLEMVLNQPGFDPEIRDFIADGLKRLAEFTTKKRLSPFEKMITEEREHTLKALQDLSWGQTWTSLILLYIFEALLSDPVYGGNPDGIGWIWLEHTPGLPRPVESTRYGATFRKENVKR